MRALPTVLALLAACSEERTLEITRLPLSCGDDVRGRVTQVVVGAEGDFAPVLVSQPPDAPLLLTSLPQDARVLTVTGTIGGQPALIGRTGILALAASVPAQLAIAYGPPGGFCATGLMQAARTNAAAVRLGDGRVLVAGGGDPSIEIYDPRTASWGGYTRYDLGPQVTAVATDDDRVLLIGDGQAQFVNGAGHLERPALFLGGIRSATAIKLADGRIFVSGTATSAIYDPTVGGFTSGPATLMRTGGSAFLLADGRVLLAGGGNDVEILDLRGPGQDIRLGGTNAPSTWAQLASGTVVGFSSSGDIAILPEEMQVLTLASHSSATSATVLADDLVLLLGGAPGVFVPSSGTTLAMSTDAAGASATLLDDGTVLIAGGGSNAAQLYFHSTINEFSTLKVMTFDSDEPGLIPRVLGSVAQRSGGGYHLQNDFALLGGVRFAGVTVRASFEGDLGDLDVLVGWLSALETFKVHFAPNTPVTLLHNGNQICTGATSPNGGFVSVEARAGRIRALDAAGTTLLDCTADLPSRFAVGVGGRDATVDDIEATR